MQLRKNQFLKSFIIILFLFEFLSPAISYSTISLSKGSAYQATGPNHLNLLINLFSEQFNENEESREEVKSIPLLSQPYGGHTFRHEVMLRSFKPWGVTKTCHPYSSSSLLTMYGEFLI